MEKNKKILCNVSNAVMPINIKEHKQNFDTYQGLLGYFDELHIICRSSVDAVVREGSICIHHVKVPNGGILRYIFSIVKMFFKIIQINKKYNISILDAAEPTTGGLVCSSVNIFINKPFLLEVQGEVLNIPVESVGWLKSKGMKYLTLLSAKMATHIRVVSDEIKFQLIENGFCEDKISLVYPRLKLDDFNIDKYSDTKPIICEQYNIDKNKKIFLFVGRLVLSKGITYLLEAIAKLDDNNIIFIIAGDGELRSELEKKAQKLNISDKVKFIGNIQYGEMPYLMSATDYFILPSVDEGFGRVIIEAMAMRLPALASRVGGIKDIIEDGKNGFFFESKNPSSIAKVIYEVLNITDEEMNGIKDRAYEKVYKNYGYEIGMENYIQMYKKILNDN